MVPQHVSEGSATPVDDEAAGGAAGVDTGKAGTGGDGGVEAGSGGDGGVDAAGGTIGTGGRKVGAVLVVGGGIAGMQASLDLAHSGFKVYLLDSAPAIGGTMAQLDKTFPTNDCSMCIMAPKLVEMGRHHNIELLTYSDLEEVSGEAGNYRVKVKKKARYIDLEACTGCGVCAEHCPIDAISSFNEGLSGRRAIFVPYPQAVPLVFTIEKDRCIGCGLCESLCLAEAIRYDDKDEIVELDVGSIILCPGFDEFDPVLKSEYGHDRYENVVSSIEFERILSATGPFKGHVQRTSEGDMPRKVAWLQCVGSRDSTVGNNYCSSVCCTYAIKEAVIAKEHVKTIEPTIFFMDMRTHGKGFEAYYNRAKDEHGVRFIRCRVARVREDPDTKNLWLTYETEEGELVEEEFQMVVLSVGFKPKETARDLARKLGLELNEFGFCETPSLHPTETGKAGIYVCGAFSGPKDIPETVMEASGAAARASESIATERGTRVTDKVLPPERDVSNEAPRIGVFVCNCGINIGGYVDVPSVVEYARTLPDVVYAEDNLYTCSQDTQVKIAATIREHDLHRVIVASCTPRTHEPLFQETVASTGLNPHLFEMANIRDQCSWVHQKEPEAATGKAKDLVRMAVAKARLLEALSEIKLPVIQKALVVGGGVTGMVSALSIAGQGYDVYLVERERELGGNANHIHFLQGGEDLPAYLRELKEKVMAHPRVHVFTSAKIEALDGYIGNFRTTLELGGEKEELEHGAVIVATGAKAYEPTEYLCGEDDRVITQRELEDRLAQGQDLGGKTFVMIQCVGSREEGRPYCSRVCCNEAVKNALKIKERHPDSRVFILYRDMRTYGFSEKYYERAREEGVIFIRYAADERPEVTAGDDGLRVMVRERVLNDDMVISADNVVLAPAIVPHEDNEDLARFLKVPINSEGFFLEAHVKLRPVDFATDGVFLAGMAHSPKTVEESIAQALAASSRAVTILSSDEVEIEPIVSQVDEAACVGCGLCVSVCPYNAIELVPSAGSNTARVNSALCKGCGLCSATCRSGAIQQGGFTDNQILSMIKGSVWGVS